MMALLAQYVSYRLSGVVEDWRGVFDHLLAGLCHQRSF